MYADLGLVSHMLKYFRSFFSKIGPVSCYTCDLCGTLCHRAHGFGLHEMCVKYIHGF